tara:strand:+ start:510 stop:701 length:192 start_codon:yes stop_codon:yes gene_type:complete
MMIKPTMSHALDKNHLNELLVKYYENLVSKYDKNLGAISDMLEEGFNDRAKSECNGFIKSLDD